MVSQDIGDYLRKLRQDNNLTQRALAEQVHVTHQAVSSWENGVSIPDIDTLSRLADLYNVSIDEILLKKVIEEEVTIATKKGKSSRLRYFLSVLGIITSLFGMSLFINYSNHYYTHIIFTAFFMVISILFMFLVKTKNKKITYYAITGLLVIFFSVLIISNGRYYSVDTQGYLIMHNKKEILYPRDLSEKTNVVKYEYIFDEYALIYNEEAADIYVFNLSEFFNEDYYVISTGDYKIKDLVILQNNIYFSSFDDQIPGEFKLLKLDFETQSISTIYEDNDIFDLYQIYERVYLISDPFYNNNTEIYLMDETEQVLLIEEYPLEINDISEFYTGYSMNILLSTRTRQGGDSISKVIVADNNFEEKYTLLEETISDIIYFDGGYGLVYSIFQDEIYKYTEDEVQITTIEGGIGVVGLMDENHIRIDDKIYNEDFEIISDFLFYSDDYRKDGAYILISNNSLNYFAIDNEFIGYLSFTPDEVGSLIIPSIFRYLILVPSIFSFGYFIVLGQKRKKVEAY